MKFRSSILLFFISLETLQSQQLPLFTQYRENDAIINPGGVSPNFLNFERPWSVAMSARTQWVGVEGGPKTQNVQAEHVFARSGVSLVTGGHIINDQAGRVGFTGVYGRLGGILSADPLDYGIAFGMTIGIVQYGVRAIGVHAVNPDDPFLQENRNKIFPDVGLGGLYYKKMSRGRGSFDMIYAGLSMPQALGLDTRFKADNGAFKTYGIKRVQHFYAELGYNRALGDDYSYVEPSIWIKYAPNGSVHLDGMFRYQFSNFVWLGLGASTSRFFNAEFGFYLGQNLDFNNDLKIGFGFDVPLQKYGGIYSKAYEVNVSYAFGTVR